MALGYGNSLRGDDSWGFYVPDSKSPVYERGLGDIMKRGVIDLAQYNFIMLHTRKSTVGKSTKENAHPFEIGDIIGAQNGGVINHDDLDKKYNRKCEVDSMHVFHHLNDGLPLQELKGYGAIEFSRKSNPNIISLANVQGGSLSIWCIGGKGDEQGVVWSSDEAHLARAMQWAKISKSTSYKVEEGVEYIVERNRPFLIHDPNKNLKFGSFSRSYETNKHWEDYRYKKNWSEDYGTYSGQSDYVKHRLPPHSEVGSSATLEVITKPEVFDPDNKVMTALERMDLKRRLTTFLQSTGGLSRKTSQDGLRDFYVKLNLNLREKRTVAT